MVGDQLRQLAVRLLLPTVESLKQTFVIVAIIAMSIVPETNYFSQNAIQITPVRSTKTIHKDISSMSIFY